MSKLAGIMRLAYFSPLPPVRTGVSEYSAELLPELARHCEVDVFLDDYTPTSPQQTARLGFFHYREFEGRYDLGCYDTILYHIANNPDHCYIYDFATRIPGIVLLHDFNLHYLIADTTIGRNDWAAYFAELRYSTGEEAIAQAERAWRDGTPLEFDRYPVNRRILETSLGLVVNNSFLLRLVRETGRHAPTIVLPHGVSRPPEHNPIPRSQLGLDHAVVVGAFGFMKPYKRIYSILRSLHAIRDLHTEIALLLVGEKHPDYPLEPLIEELGLTTRVRCIGFVPTPEVWAYLEACDICCNLRFPTVGESSGPLMKIMALGKPVIVSDIGSYMEIPDDCCIKIPAGDQEEEAISKAFTHLIESPATRRAIGEKARAWALAEERSWRSLGAGLIGFSKRLPAPARVDSLSPSGAETGGPDFWLTATGGPWKTDTTLYWNDCGKATVFVNRNELRARACAEDIAQPGIATVTVRDSNGAVQGSRGFRVEYPTARVIKVIPAYAVAGSNDLHLEIEGGPFLPSAVARWNGRDCQMRFRNAEKLEMVIPQEELKEPCRGHINIYHPLQKCSGAPFVIRSPDAIPEPSETLGLPPGFYTYEVRSEAASLDGLGS